MLAHPQVVGGDRADLRHLEHRAELVADRAQRRDGGGAVAAVDEPLGLDLGAGARCEAGPEVGQAIRPQARDAELRRAVDGVLAGDRVDVGARGARSEQRVGHRLRGAGRHAPLEPHLIDRGVPARERADAVGRAHDGVEASEERVPPHVEVDALGDVVGGLDVEGHARDRPQRAQADDHPGEVGLSSHDVDERAVRRDELQPGDGRGEVAEAVARAVRAGGDRAADRDVRQRRHRGKGELRRSQGIGKLGVRQSRGDRDRAGGVVDGDLGREPVERQQLVGVADVGERVPRPDDADARRAGHGLSDIVERHRPADPRRPVDVVAGPVGPGHRQGPCSPFRLPTGGSALHGKTIQSSVRRQT